MLYNPTLRAVPLLKKPTTPGFFVVNKSPADVPKSLSKWNGKKIETFLKQQRGVKQKKEHGSEL